MTLSRCGANSHRFQCIDAATASALVMSSAPSSR